MELELFSSLIETLYDAALNPSEWPRVARLFAQALGSESCAIWHLNRAPRRRRYFRAYRDSRHQGHQRLRGVLPSERSRGDPNGPIRHRASDAQHGCCARSGISRQRDLHRLCQANASRFLLVRGRRDTRGAKGDGCDRHTPASRRTSLRGGRQTPPRHAVTSPVAGDGSATQTPRPY